MIHFPESTNVSIFSFLPMGLVRDGADQAQWSHLVEHLVIRSTVPVNSQEANAETLPDHMRLDFYGNTATWKTGLSHHRRWIEGVPFTAASLQAEKPRVNRECDSTARNFATHKFAIAAWSQGYRHSKTNVAIKGDVTNASLAEIQRHRDSYLVGSNQVLLCVVGGITAEKVLPEIEKQFGDLNLQTLSIAPLKTTPAKLDLTWDLNARHLLLTWPIGKANAPEYAALMVAAQCINMELASDSALMRDVGMPFAGVDLATPEGNFFFISAALRPQASFEDILAKLQSKVAALSSNTSALVQAPFIGIQLANSITQVPDPRGMRSEVPSNMSPALFEGNLGLQFVSHEYRYGSQRDTLAKQLAEVSPEKLIAAVKNRLTTQKVSICTLQPAPPAATKK